MSYSNGSMSSALDICLSKCVSVACMMCGLCMSTSAKNSCRFDSLFKLLQLTFKSMILSDGVITSVSIDLLCIVCYTGVTVA
jgi:hypothetical protein